MKILYICTHNRCRSILSEAISNQQQTNLLDAKSAGSQPVAAVHPLSIHYLQQAGYSASGLTSKSWDELSDFQPDVIITVCDSAAGEVCPIWFGNTLKIHWGLADPSKVIGSEAEVASAFADCINTIEQRVIQLQKIAQLDQNQWHHALIALGK